MHARLNTAVPQVSGTFELALPAARFLHWKTVLLCLLAGTVGVRQCW